MSLGDLQGFHLSADDALFADFDGTIADLGPDPDAIRLDLPTTRALARIAAALGQAAALISGRDVRDLASRAPDVLWRLGGHGLEAVGPGATLPEPPPPPPDAVLDILAPVATDGVRLELKGPVAALHYRAAPGAEAACLAAAERAARAVPEHVMQAGKMVVEVKPARAHKGTALRRCMSGPPFAGRRPVMLGDDTTDEDAIAAAQDLGGIGVRIGPGATAARLRAPDPAAVRAWLGREADRLAT